MMESQCEYSVRTKNRFVLDDIEGDPFELIKETQSKPKKEKAKKLAAPKKEDAPVINNNVEDAVPTENSQRGGQRGGAARGVRGGRGRGGGQGRGERVITETCYKCQEVGHFARDCVNAPPPPPMECHNCKGPHMVRDCTEPREPRRAPQPVRICHRCQEEGHFVRDCPQPNPVQQQKGPCHNCQEFGHFVRECPNESSADNTESAGFGEGDLDGGMGGFGSPGDANEVSNDFGGFGGFGTPSGGFGEPDERGSEGRGRGRGRGGRGGRGRGGGGRGRLDRHSGNDKSGVKATEKKDGHGANNWGKSTDQESYVDDAKFDSPVETDQEDDSNTMTYENWKAQQAGLDTKPQFDIRKVECDGKQVEFKKKDPVESNAMFTGQEYYEYRVKDSGRKHVRCDQKIIAFEFDGGSNRQLGSERGGRGRGGQRAGRSEKRANDNKENVAFFVNSEDFPTL